MRRSADSVVSLYYLKLLHSIIGELSSGHYPKFRTPETVKYKKRRRRRLYSFKKTRRASARRSRRLRRLVYWRRGSV